MNDSILRDDKPGFLPVSTDFKAVNSPFYWTARMNAKYTARLDELLKSSGMNGAKWRVLMILHEYERLSMSEISKHVVAKLSTITKTVYRMQNDGLVQTVPSSTDARVTEVYLTEMGESKLSDVRRIVSRFAEIALDDFSPEEVRTLTLMLERVFRNMNGV